MKRRRTNALVVTGALILCGLGLPRVAWEDDPQKLTVLDPEVEAEDARVRKVALGQEGGEFVVLVSHAAPQESLVANDALAVLLDRAVAQGVLGGYASVHNVIWSEALQRRNLQWVQAHLPVERIEAALLEQDFVPDAFSPFGRGNADLSLPPLRLADLPKDSYETLVAPWFVSLTGGRTGLLTRLANVKDREALMKALSAVPSAHYVNVGQFRSKAYSQFRTRMLWLVGLGLLAVALILLVRYRNARLALCAFGPAVLSAVVATAMLGLLGQTLNLMHVMGLLLVLSMGADYGIFMVESLTNRTPLGPPVLSIAMACVSTVLSFGLLALSASPALKAVGQMTGMGIMAAWVFSAALSGLLMKEPHA